jgi:hypothetical protein
MTGCSTTIKDVARQNGCDPDSRHLKPFTMQFKSCQENFPALADRYKKQEQRAINGECHWHDCKFPGINGVTLMDMYR